MRRFFFGLWTVLLVSGVSRAATFNIANGDVAALKGAINSANASNAVNTIELSANGTYTLTAVDNTTNGANGLPALGSSLGGSLVVNGNGATITRSSASGTPVFRILRVTGSTKVTLNSLTISNGIANTYYPAYLGAGVYNDHGALTLNNCTISGNAASYGGGIYNDGTGSGTHANLVMNGCTVSGNTAVQGGGVRNDGSNGGATLQMNNCTVTGNFAAGNDTYGAGIQNVGSNGKATLGLTDCTISSNHSNGTTHAYGGGISNDNAGDSTSVTLKNTTVSNNTATTGGGIFNNHSPLAIRNCTVSANTATTGAGIYNDGSQSGSASVAIFNSTLANNSASGSVGGIYNNGANGGSATTTLGSNIFKTGLYGGNVANASGTITSLGYNLSDDIFGGELTAPTDKISTDPKLGSFGDHGGPTSTFDLLPGSPAIDKGKRFGTITTDQRGRLRPYNDPAIANATGGDGTDIGAYEDQGAIQSGPNFVVNTIDDHFDDSGGCTAGDCTLREAIFNASIHAGADTITFAAKVTGIINLSSALPNLNTDLTIQGPGANVLTVRRNTEDSYRIFTVSNGTTSGPTVSISGLTIANGLADGDPAPANYGGGILNDHGTLTVAKCTFSNNVASYGGAICNDGENSSATLTLRNSTIANSTALAGASVYNNATASGDAGLVVTNCTFSSNGAFVSSGGIVNDGSGGGRATATVQSCTFSDNKIALDNYAPDGTASLTVGNNILVNDATTANIVANGGTITSQGFNLTSDDSSAFLNQNTDLKSLNPLLGPLQDNGGPTQTMALPLNSPAVDRGKSFGLATDQRGMPRPSVQAPVTYVINGDKSDIGAFELQFIPKISVNAPASKPEGSAAAPGSVNFDITLDYPSAQTVTVNYQTADGIANPNLAAIYTPAKAGSDYVEKHGKLTFAPGETLKRVTIAFIGDSVPEADETFYLQLNTPTNATIAHNQGLGTIANDDGIGIAIADAAPVDEGDSGLTPQTFVVRLSAASTSTIKVNWATANSSTNAADYVAASGTLSFAPGQTSKLITIQVKGDEIVEPNETYKVNLSSPVNAVITDAQGIATICNDDATQKLLSTDEPSQ